MRILTAAAAAGIAMGGWAVVTVRELPEYYVAGQRYTIEFQVRQHGRTLLSGLEPHVIVSTSPRRLGGLLGGDNETNIVARPATGEGAYSATFTAPAGERLFLSIESGFRDNAVRLYPAPIVRAGSSRAAMTAAERGQVLFVAKGCNVCHLNGDLVDRPDNLSMPVGPDLSGHRLAREYVIQKIKHPASQVMPDLGLSDGEANAIASFLTNERTAAAGR